MHSLSNFDSCLNDMSGGLAARMLVFEIRRPPGGG